MKRELSSQVPARYYARMLEELALRGYATAPLLDQAGLRAEQVFDRESELTLSQIEALVEEVLRSTARSDIALDLGRVIKTSSHSMVGYAMLTSPTLDYALRLAARYFGLLLPTFRMRYTCQAESAEISFKPVLPMSPRCLLFHLEAIAAAVHAEAHELLQLPVLPYQLWVSYPEPPHVRRYEEFRGVVCHFSHGRQPGLRIVMPVAVVHQPLPLADAAALSMAEDRCRELVQHALSVGKIRDWVVMMVQEAQDGLPTLTELARTLNLSPRTLDRYLRQEGTTFREVSLQVRHARACRLLKEGRQSITQIALQLGYSDAANFTRAFRRACGQSPSQYSAAGIQPGV